MHVSEKWWQLFRKRHPDLSLRKTEAFGKGRSSLTIETLTQHFRRLEVTSSSFGFHPALIFNADETGVTPAGKDVHMVAAT